MRHFPSCRSWSAALAAVVVPVWAAIAAPLSVSGGGAAFHAGPAVSRPPGAARYHPIGYGHRPGRFGRAAFNGGHGRFAPDRLRGGHSRGFYGYGYGYGGFSVSAAGDDDDRAAVIRGLPVVLGVAAAPAAAPQVTVINGGGKARAGMRASTLVLHGPGGPGYAPDRAAFAAPRIIRVDVPPG